MPNATPSPAFNPAQLDAIAKKRGYKSYDQMIYSMQNRLPPPKVPGQSPEGGGPGNFLRELFNDPAATLKSAFSWHPSETIGRASGKLRKANQRRRR